MTIERAMEILNPDHRECYDGLDEVSTARSYSYTVAVWLPSA